MTTSVYDVIKYTDLQTYMGGITFSSIDALYTQVVVESWISEAEYMVRTITHTDPSSSVPFDVMAVKLLSERIAYDNMIKNNNAVASDKVSSMHDRLSDLQKLWEVSQNTKNAEKSSTLHLYDIDY